MSERYESLRQHLRELAALNSTLGLLGWDQETMMPARAASARADELSLLSRLAHERATAAVLGDLLSECEADAALIIASDPMSNFSQPARDHLASIPSVVLDPKLSETAKVATVAFTTATYGINTRFLRRLSSTTSAP